MLCALHLLLAMLAPDMALISEERLFPIGDSYSVCGHGHDDEQTNPGHPRGDLLGSR